MIFVSITYFANSFVNRDDGTSAAIDMIAEFYKPVHVNEYEGMLSCFFLPEDQVVGIEIIEHLTPSHSFLDEIIYRLDEKDLLHRFRFKIHDEKVLVKLTKISNDRQLPIKINWQDKDQEIEPADEPAKARPDIVFKYL